MSGSLASAARSEPNLTPILDLVFQLITFFMLVINFKSQEIDTSLRLPVVGSARPVATEEAVLVLNIDAAGELNVYGVHRADVENFIRLEAKADLGTAKRKNPAIKAGDELPTIVVVRAGQATPFTKLFRVIKCCQEHGYRQFALKAMMRKEDIPE
jgi:biopolymer transport protein ExbD